jgi:sugar/nucleoside kinase (ribokinase family)
VKPVAAIIEEWRHRPFEIIFVATPSLPPLFLKNILPLASVVIGAWDDLQFLTGDTPVTIAGARTMAARLRHVAPDADVHITMGDRGVISMPARSLDCVHVELLRNSAAAVETRAVIARGPARLCGAGDAFAAGVMVRRAFDWSLMCGVNGYGRHVHDALGGCTSALHWIGIPCVGVDAFTIRSIPVPKCA